MHFFLPFLAVDQHGACSFDKFSAKKLVLEWNTYGVDVVAIVMRRSIND